MLKIVTLAALAALTFSTSSVHAEWRQCGFLGLQRCWVQRRPMYGPVVPQIYGASVVEAVPTASTGEITGPARHCPDGGQYSARGEVCRKHISDAQKIREILGIAHVQGHINNDSNCHGHPTGYQYQTELDVPGGIKMVATHTCH